ncbi:MAG: septal ring lytic transglycosylase RlpA family protein [Bacteroidota bacterium]
MINLSFNSFCQKRVLGAEKLGLCSFYANKFDGLQTANGEKYDKDQFTAAHKSLPFNTILAVFNLETEKYVIVRVNDRGPYRKTRLIDISRAAAVELGIVSRGIAKVKIRILGFDNFQNLEPIDPPGLEAEFKN